MYLHIGQDVAVRQREILGIFDMDNTTISRHTREFLARAEKAGRVEYVSMELPKSFVVCAAQRRRSQRRQETVYVAQMSPATLRKRARRMDSISNV